MKYKKNQIIMDTPIRKLLIRSKSFNLKREMLLPFLMNNALNLLFKKKIFITQGYNDALEDSDLNDAQIKTKAELYYNKNYNNK